MNYDLLIQRLREDESWQGCYDDTQRRYILKALTAFLRICEENRFEVNFSDVRKFLKAIATPYRLEEL